MGDIHLNTVYLRTNRGLIKILQIVFGFIICSLLCVNWYGGRSCFFETRLGIASGLNFVVVVVNVVLFVLNFLNLGSWGLEKTYSTICTILFLIASIIVIWVIIDSTYARGDLIAAAVLIIIEFLLFLWDVKILQGEASN